ncbi:acid-sensing ion channel 4-A-like [Amphiura filiformis]|uniref:acid-sensing ion channel 4-A-like n=1 Tax=Amphiura filiformis TaxID=82378 RepID=UPI003B21FDE5
MVEINSWEKTHFDHSNVEIMTKTGMNLDTTIGPPKTAYDTTMDIMDASDNKQQQGSGNSSVLLKYSQETSISGLKYIGEDGSFLRRFIWLLVVLLALAGLLYQIVNCTNKFIRRPTSTKLTYNERDILHFPAVTICNTNMFLVDKVAEEFGDYYTLFTFGFNQLLTLFPQTGGITSPGDVELPDTWPGNVSLYDFIVNNAHSKDEAFILCQFNGAECGPENFTTIVTNYGVCYTFNSFSMEPPQVVKIPGQPQGLSVLLNSETLRHIPAPRQNTGFKILLHPRDEIPNLVDFGVELDLGKRTSLRIEPTEVTRLPDPYGDCWTDDEKELTDLPGRYTKHKCFLECETAFIVSNCSCRTFYMPGSAPYCDPITLVECYYTTHKYFSANKKDICHCEVSCEETKYKASISQSTFPSATVPQLLNMNQDYDFERNAFNEAMGSGYAPAVYEQVFRNITERIMSWISLTTNSNNETLLDVFPFETILYHFGNEATNLIWIINPLLYEHLYDIVAPHGTHVNASYGSTIYYTYEQTAVWSLLHSGFYKNQFANTLFELYYTSVGSTNLTFDEFVDHMYTEFHMEESFYVLMRIVYEVNYDALTETLNSFYLETDLAVLTTDYMRATYAFVEIYYGDLVVQQIEEQKDYELFQFICDWGGALGLFFGASLLSFVETIDFFSRGVQVKTSTSDNMIFLQTSEIGITNRYFDHVK